MITNFKFHIDNKVYIGNIRESSEYNNAYFFEIEGQYNTFLFEKIGYTKKRLLEELGIKEIVEDGTWPYTTLEDCYKILYFIADKLPKCSFFKKGDKVRIKPRRGEDSEYQFSFVDTMNSLAHKEFTIEDTASSTYDQFKYPAWDKTVYTLNGEARYYSWSVEMLEKVESTKEESTSEYPYITGELEPGKEIEFHLSKETIIEGKINLDGNFVLITPHSVGLVDRIFDAFHEPIDKVNREDIWPESKNTLLMLQNWKDRNPHPIVCTDHTEESTKSLTQNKEENYVVFELQNQRANFTRREISRRSELRCKITEATISVKPLSYRKISFRSEEQTEDC